MRTELFEGFLFIGDPHVSSKKIGRRKDDYLSSVLLKLEHCAQLCALYNFAPVILGDLFHRNDDSNLTMLNRLIKVLKLFPVKPIVLEGNHDKEQSKITDHDAIALLSLAGVIQVVETCGEVGVFNIKNEPVRLWGCPYGAEIPESLPPFQGTTVMVTHHDLAFASSYIGSKPLIAVENCNMVVNGHMHDTKPSIKVGSTWWHNPGNIEPLSKDLITHVPKAWEWAPSQGVESLIGHELPHGSDLFDLTGDLVAAADSATAVAALAPTPTVSQFAVLLREQSDNEAQRTDDASVLAEDVEHVLATAGASEATRQLMAQLLDAVQSDLATS